MRQQATPYQPSERASWAIGILSAPQDKHGALMRRLALRCLHRRDSGHKLHDSAQCDLCIPAKKYFTPAPGAAEKPQGAAATRPALAATPAAKPIPLAAARIQPVATHKALAGLAQILRSPNSDERKPQLREEKRMTNQGESIASSKGAN